MMVKEDKYTGSNLEFWGGIECTINRVNDSYFDQLDISGHYRREGDIQLISELGIKKLRYPILWEKHQPERDHEIDWSYAKKRLTELDNYGITPVAGLLHHGSGPRYTNLLDENFPHLFASYAAKVARQFPFLKFYTPINEPLTTARFSGLYGFWYPHICNDVSFVKMLLNQIKATILAMREIRKINPDAMLVQTEDLSKTYSTPLLRRQAAFENERRWLTYDLLCGKVRPGHGMWDYFIRLGIRKESLNFFIENAMPPDIMGFNYYITSERYLDEDLRKYPVHAHGGNEIQQYADVEAIRINHGHPFGLKVLLAEAWKRFQLPIAITEAHINSGREDQLRWLKEILDASSDAINEGMNIKAITFWSLFGAYGWNNLLTSERMEYEPGAFDLRSGKPRPTAIATFIKKMAKEKKYTHSLLDQKGWWHQTHRFYKHEVPHKSITQSSLSSRPLVIVGKTGTLGQAFAKICGYRNIPYMAIGREVVDITSENSINEFLDAQKPWAVINTAGFVNVDHAEDHPQQCFDVNTEGPVLLSKGCRERDISFMTFSSDLVFDGKKSEPYFESDIVRPLNVYGASKAMAENKIIQDNPRALIIRTSSFFGPWDTHNFVYKLLSALTANERFPVADDINISPTYVPHLVSVSLELLIDKECGLWHITNDGALSWKEFALKIADKAGYNSRLIVGTNLKNLGLKSLRPKNSALKSERCNFLPSLDHAIDCFFNECATLHSYVMKPEQNKILI